MQNYSTEDLLEVALPKLAAVASLWDFLSASLPKGEKLASDVATVLQEYNRFRCQVWLIIISSADNVGSAYVHWPVDLFLSGMDGLKSYA